MAEEVMTMEAAKMGWVLGSIESFREQVKELRVQQTHLLVESLTRFVAWADLPVPMSCAKRQKRSIHPCDTSGVENVKSEKNGRDKDFIAASMVRRVQQNSCKANASRPRRKPLVDSRNVNHAFNVDGVHEEEIFHQTGSEVPFYSVEGNEENSVSGREVHITSVGETEESVPSLVKPSNVVGTNSTSRGGKPSQRKTEPAEPPPPRMTRARAKILENAVGNTTIAGEGPPLKKPRARRWKSSSISSSPGEKKEDEGNLQTIMAQTSQEFSVATIVTETLEGVIPIFSESLVHHQSKEGPSSGKPLAVKRNATATIWSPAKTAIGQTEASGAVLLLREEQDKKALKLDNAPAIIYQTGVTENIGQGPPSPKSKISEGKTKIKSRLQAETDGQDLGKLKDVNPSIHCVGDVQDFVEEHTKAGPYQSRKSKEGSRNARALSSAAVEMDGNASKLERDMAQSVYVRRTVTDKHATKSTSYETNALAALSSLHGDELEKKEDMMMDAFGTECVDLHSPQAKQARYEISETNQGVSLFSFRKVLEARIPSPHRKSDILDQGKLCSSPGVELAFPEVDVGGSTFSPDHLPNKTGKERERKEDMTMDAIGTECVDLHSPQAKQATYQIAETNQGIPLISFRKVLEVNIPSPSRKSDILDQGESCSSPGMALPLPEVDVGRSKFSPDHLPDKTSTRRERAGTLVGTEVHLARPTATPQVYAEEVVEEEIGAIMPIELQVKVNERIDLRGTFVEGYVPGRLSNSTGCEIVQGRASSNFPDLPKVMAEKGKLIITHAVDLSSSSGNEDREETASSPENRRINFAGESSEETQQRKEPSIGCGNTLPVLCNSRRSNLACDDDSNLDGFNLLKDEDEGAVQRYTEASCGKDFKLSTKAGCLQTFNDGKEMGVLATPSLTYPTASEHTELRPHHMEGSAAIDNDHFVRQGSETTLTSRAYVGLCRLCRVFADAAEDARYKIPYAEPYGVYDGRGQGVGGEISEKVLPYLELLARGTNRPSQTTSCTWCEFRRHLERSYYDTKLGWQASYFDDMQAKVDEFVGNSTEVSRSMGLRLRADLSVSQMLDYALMAEKAVHKHVREVGFNELHQSAGVRENAGHAEVSSVTTRPETPLISRIVKYMIGKSPLRRPSVVDTCLAWHGPEIREVSEVGSATDPEPRQEGNAIQHSSILVKDQYQQGAVSSCSNLPSVKDCLCKAPSDCHCSVRDKRLPQDELQVTQPLSLARAEEVRAVFRFGLTPKDDGVPALDPYIAPAGLDYSLQQCASSKSDSVKKTSNLVTMMKTFVPARRPPPSFLPKGKREMGQKSASVAFSVEEKRVRKERQRKVETGEEENSTCAMESQDAHIPIRECAEASRCEEESMNHASFLPQTSKLFSDRSNIGHVNSQDAKLKRTIATNLEIEKKKFKKFEVDTRRNEEQRKKNDPKLLLLRTKEQLVRKEREKTRQRQEMLKQRKDESRLCAERDDKGQRKQAQEQVQQRERKAMEEKIIRQRCTMRHTEMESSKGEELEMKYAARQGIIQAQQMKKKAINEKKHDDVEGPVLRTLDGPGQKCIDVAGRIGSNLLEPGLSHPLKSAVQIQVVSTEKRARINTTTAIHNKGCYPPSSSSKLRLLNGDVTKGSTQTSAFTHSSVDDAPVNDARGGSGSHVSGVENLSPVVESKDMGPMSYEISPYRESSDDEDQTPPAKTAKPIPFWAKKDNLNPQLLKQLTLDPDEIFGVSNTCSLKEVFGTTGSKKIQDFSKRSGSGDWVKDRVCWKEELQYKIDMRYMQKN